MSSQAADSGAVHSEVPGAAALGCASRAARAADDKLGRDIVVLQVGPIIGITEAFVIASASNNRQLRTIVDEVQHALRVDHDRRPRSIEGLESEQWVLLDYGDFVVHVFLDETRDLYGLERLWADAPRIAWSPAEASA